MTPSPYRAPEARDPAEPQGPTLTTEGGRELPLVSAVLRVEAGSGIACALLEQEFENDSDDVLRVTYKMPLPADGAVSGYAFTIGARTVRGRVDPKKVARERFEEALASGKTAAILEQDRPDIFTQDIGNIPPRTTIKARITVDLRLAWLAEGEWELRFPTVIGPRYLGAAATEAEAKAVGIEVAPELRARLHLEVRVRDELTTGRRVESPSHALRDSGDGAFELAAIEGARLDRDVVVRWAVTKPQVGVAIETARHAGATYALLAIVPPARDARVPTTPRDLVVLLDTSGSMGGTPLDSAKKVVASLVASLGEGDRLEMIEFSNAPRPWRLEPSAATEGAKRDALQWLRGLRASGGTEMQTAVMAALRSLRPGAQRQVVLVTDGYIGGEERIVAALAERLPEGSRLHFVGVGAAPNRSLAAAMARAGRGAEIQVAPGEDAERGAERLLARTEAPVLTEVGIEGAEGASRFLPDVFAGSPVLAAVKLREGDGDLVVRGRLANGAWQQRVRVPTTVGDRSIPALFAREKVADLEIESILGQDRGAAIEALGVDFQIATRMTSWIAIDEDASVDPYAPSRHVEIPQELPYGTSLASFGLGGAEGGGGRSTGSFALARASMAMAMPQAPGYGAPMRERRMQQSFEQAAALMTTSSPMLAGAPKRSRSRGWLLFFVLVSFVIALVALAWYLLR